MPQFLRYFPPLWKNGGLFSQYAPHQGQIFVCFGWVALQMDDLAMNLADRIWGYFMTLYLTNEMISTHNKVI